MKHYGAFENRLPIFWIRLFYHEWMHYEFWFDALRVMLSFLRMLYPGLIPVESVSWMLLSAGAKLETRSGLGVEGCLL